MSNENESETPYVARPLPGKATELSTRVPSAVSGQGAYRPNLDVSTVGTGEPEWQETAAARPRKTTKKNGVPDALDVARYLVRLAASESEPDFLSHMRLQKLLYYTQGWSLALRDRPMFSERIEAWAHGPVVRDLYPLFADFGDTPIPPERMALPESLSPDDRAFVESVWEAYKGYSTTSLREMTHKERPWRDARGTCGPADRCTTEITQDSMRRFFKQASKRRGEAQA